MAAIDKIYGNAEQYFELYDWAKAHKPEIIEYMCDKEDWLNEWSDGLEHPISNFPSWVDYWLIANCPISFIVTYIKNQYGDDTDYTHYPFVFSGFTEWEIEYVLSHSLCITKSKLEEVDGYVAFRFYDKYGYYIEYGGNIMDHNITLHDYKYSKRNKSIEGMARRLKRELRHNKFLGTELSKIYNAKEEWWKYQTKYRRQKSKL